MIPCSPQELIAESLINCLRSHEIHHFQNCKSLQKPTIVSSPHRVTDKISLKKSQSQKKISTPCQSSSSITALPEGKFSKNYNF